jgi:ABC-type Fe3+-siderophore transport system permease subunit
MHASRRGFKWCYNEAIKGADMKFVKNPVALIVGGFVLISLVAFMQQAVHNKLAQEGTLNSTSSSTNEQILFINLVSLSFGLVGLTAIIAGIVGGVIWLVRRGNAKESNN